MTNPRKRSLPPALQEQVDEVRAIGRLVPFLRLLSWFGIGGDRLRDSVLGLKDAKAEFDSIIRLIDPFHEAFSGLGWLFSDSTKVETARMALEAHYRGNLEEAETLLASDYAGDRLSFVVTQLCELDEFRQRRDQLRETSELTREGRYLAATPLLLVIADGVGTDAFGKSIFAEGVELEELKSFSGQPDALPELIRELCRTRRKTSSDEITFPYRNGILHGRDLGYGNKLVNAKCWSMLGNIADVIRARRAGQAPKSEHKPSIGESIARYSETKRLGQRIDEWVPRSVKDEPIQVSSDSGIDVEAGEPESAMVDFLRAWRDGNYGQMATMTHHYDEKPINRRAGEIREFMQEVMLIDAVITRIEDVAPAVTEIAVDLKLRANDQDFINGFVFRLICRDNIGGTAIHGDEGARWLIQPDYQYQYWNMHRS